MKKFFTNGLGGAEFPQDTATAEVFNRALNGKNGKKRYAHAVKVLVRRAMLLPQKEDECAFFLAEIARECGFRRVVAVLADFGIKHPRSRELCQRLVAGVCDASSE